MSLGCKWGYGLLLNTADVPGMRRATRSWTTQNHTHFWVDPAVGFATRSTATFGRSGRRRRWSCTPTSSGPSTRLNRLRLTFSRSGLDLSSRRPDNSAPSKVRNANRFHGGTTSGLSTGAGANSVSDVTHRIMAWATTTSHTTPMDAHIVTAPLRTGVVPRHPTHGYRS